MNVGDMKDRIDLQKKKANDGVIVDLDLKNNYEDYKTIWAKAEFYSSKEVYSANAINILNALKFIVRMRKDITPDMVIKWQNNLYEIKGIRPLDNTKTWLLINCELIEHE